MKVTVLNKELYEKVKNRPLETKEILELENHKEYVLVKASMKVDPKLSIKREDEGYKFLVSWGDSVEEFQGYLTAYEEFAWCVEISAKEDE